MSESLVMIKLLFVVFLRLHSEIYSPFPLAPLLSSVSVVFHYN